MLSALYYLLLVLLCTLFMILSALALVVCYPFDRGRRTVHELSRILVRIFFFLPPFWRQAMGVPSVMGTPGFSGCGSSGGGSWVPGAEGSPGGWVGSGCLPSGGLHRLQLASGAEEGPGRSGRA